MSTCEGVKLSAPMREWHEADAGAEDRLCSACRQKMIAAEAEAPREWQLYALDRPEGLQHFYPSTLQCRMCGDDPIVLVRLRLDDDGPLWAWYRSFHPGNGSAGGGVGFVYQHRIAVEVCFTYGAEAEFRRGRGRMVRLSVEKLRPAVHPEGLR